MSALFNKKTTTPSPPPEPTPIMTANINNASGEASTPQNAQITPVQPPEQIQPPVMQRAPTPEELRVQELVKIINTEYGGDVVFALFGELRRLNELAEAQS